MSWAAAGRTVLVTGGNGFIGAWLCRRLVHEGAVVHIVSRDSGTRAVPGVKRWSGDLAESSVAHALVEEIRPETIFHLAGHAKGAREPELVGPTLRSNLLGTVNVLLAAGDAGCRRVIMTGSLEEPDAADGSQAIPSSPYAASKWAASSYARMFHALYRLPVVILRLFMVYGPAEPALEKLVPYVILSLLRGETPRLGSGRRPVDWVYVDDVVEAFLAAARVDGVEGRTLDVGSGQLVPVRSVVERLADLIDPTIAPSFGARTDRPLEQVRSADVAATRAALGWAPTTSLEDGLRRTVNWYAETTRTGCREGRKAGTST